MCTMDLTRKELVTLEERVSQLKDGMYALYQLEDAEEFSFEAAVNSAIASADKTRVQVYNDLHRRLQAIRSAPQAALWIGIPDDIPRPQNAIVQQSNPPAAAPAPNQNQAGPSTSGQNRSRSTQRAARPQQGPRSQSRKPPRAPKQQPRPANQGFKSKKGKNFKKSTPYARSNSGGRYNRQETKAQRFYNHCRDFFIGDNDEQ